VLFKEVITVYSENHPKPINTLYMQNADLLIKPVLYIVTTGLYRFRWYRTSDMDKFLVEL
jgi:hypothetical protein